MRIVKAIRDNMGEPGDQFIPVTEELKSLVLIAKLHEEVSEIGQALDDPYEYGDVLTALKALAKRNGLSWKSVLYAAQRKGERNGGFSKVRVIANG